MEYLAPLMEDFVVYFSPESDYNRGYKKRQAEDLTWK
jgi:hypothetical protein